MKTATKNIRNWLVPLCVSAVMLALATVLSLLKYSFPWGGSITLASMVPIIFVSLAYGPGVGLSTAFLHSLIQLFLDLGAIMGWGLTKEMLIGVILLDYILPFTAIGISGFFTKKSFKLQMTGVALAVTFRYAFHVISGAALWHSAGKIWDALVIENEWLYSLVYNACYMLPELVITVVAVNILFKNKNVSSLLEKSMKGV